MSFLVAAYAVLWIGLFAYLVSLARRLRALSEEARAFAEEEGCAGTPPAGERGRTAGDRSGAAGAPARP
ncbi:MAG TPA: CcmD family protein [Gemmatimonadota bacterium]